MAEHVDIASMRWMTYDYVPYMSLANREMNGASKALFYDFFPSNLVTEKPTLLEIRSLFSVSTK